jgi:hypothetical protein
MTSVARLDASYCNPYQLTWGKDPMLKGQEKIGQKAVFGKVVIVKVIY